jgi:cytoskeletal protein RodZ
MDHKDQHHQHHQKEREHEQREWKERNLERTGKRHGIHPAWYVVVAAVLCGTAVLVWTFFIR